MNDVVLGFFNPLINRLIGFIAGLFISAVSLDAAKIVPSVILASIEGEVYSFSLEDEFKVTLDSSSVGKKFSQKSILSTGKDGKAGLLFSNGALITIKPGSRFYLRKYNQKIVTNAAVTNPSKMEEEPSNSELLAHLDFGELIVKAPKLNKGSTMVLSSPLGTAGIRGTMFQMMAVRNPLTGDISGGVNLISGDIDFTDTSGSLVTLVSGQSIVAATSKLGESIGSQSGGLVDLSSTFGPALSGSGMPPAMDSLFPPEAAGDEESSSEESSSSDFSSSPFSAGGAGGWEMVHELASAVFFEIEESESSASNISFESMQMAVTLDTPSPQLTSPTAPAILTGGSDSPMIPDPFQGANPSISLVGDSYLYVELTDKDFSEFDPWIKATDFLGNDISARNKNGQSSIELLQMPNLQEPGIYPIEYKVTDLRGLSSLIRRTVEVIATPPSINFFPGKHGGGFDSEGQFLNFLVETKYPDYIENAEDDDDGQFKFSLKQSSVYPSFQASYYDGRDLNLYVSVDNVFVYDFGYASAPDYKSIDESSVDTRSLDNFFHSLLDTSKIGQSKFNFVVNDFSLRNAKMPNGSPVETSVSINIKVIDNLPPKLSVASGSKAENPHVVKGVLGTTFVDPGIKILDNYYSQEEIEEYLGNSAGSVESSFGTVNMEVAGDYEVVYQGISDPSGNEASPIRRWVRVTDNEPPLLTIYGSDPLFVDVNNSKNIFRDPGAVAFDNLDETIEWNPVSLENNKTWNPHEFIVDMQLVKADGTLESLDSSLTDLLAKAKLESTNKTFQMVYFVKDKAGNVGSTTRQIVLINSPFDKPFIVDNSPDKNPLIVDVKVNGDPRTGLDDPGVSAYLDFGEELDKKNITNRVNIQQLIGGTLGAINDSVVNYSLKDNHFVNPEGEKDPSFRTTIQYTVQDDFGNEANYTRLVQIVDRHGPVISLLDGSEGAKDYRNLQAGISFTDPGYTARDNYDENVTVTSRLFSVESGEEEMNFDIVADLGFVKTGAYEIRYNAIDKNGNNASENDLSDTVRKINVVDTIPPTAAVFTHSYLRGDDTSLTMLNDPNDLPAEVKFQPIVDVKNPVPDKIETSLITLKGWNENNKAFDSNVTLTTPITDTNFYFFAEENDISKEAKIEEVIDQYGRYRYRMSAFSIVKNGVVVFEDPGIYVRNDSNIPLNFEASIDRASSKSDLYKMPYFDITYIISQQNGTGKAILEKVRKIHLIDNEKPTIFAEPHTDGENVFIILEAGEEHKDKSGDIVKLFESNTVVETRDDKKISLNLYALDPPAGLLITDKIIRTIKNQEGEQLTFPDNQEIPYNQILDSSALDAKYIIEYEVTDEPHPELPETANTSDVVKRHLIVKDTKPPVINLGADSNTTLVVDFLSDKYPNVKDAKSVATYLLTGLSATDANDFDTDLDVPSVLDPDHTKNWELEFEGDNVVRAIYQSKWELEFNPAFEPGAIYPPKRDSGTGYEVLISVSDQSGNVSVQKILRYLKVGDFTPPYLTLIGDFEIHDFMRFKSNSEANSNQFSYLQEQGYSPGTAGANGKNTPFTDQPFSFDNNPEYNATGFNGGEHRMLLADYNFVDPGAYAEDQNAYFDIKDDYPDLDGDGVGEGHAIVRVQSRQEMNDCSKGSGKIHIYSFFEKNQFTVDDWQKLMEDDYFGFNTELLNDDGNATGANSVGAPAKIPDVKEEDYTDLNKSDLTNLDMTTITIEYRVMDGWENKSDILTRLVYIYESRQYDGYAFYATPLTDASGNPFESYYDNNSTDVFGRKNPFMTSERKDLDGDGVSDFWEFAFGTDYKDASDFPIMNDESTFINAFTNENLLRERLGKLNDASSLSNVPGLKDFKATEGL